MARQTLLSPGLVSKDEASYPTEKIWVVGRFPNEMTTVNFSGATASVVPSDILVRSVYNWTERSDRFSSIITKTDQFVVGNRNNYIHENWNWITIAPAIDREAWKKSLTKVREEKMAFERMRDRLLRHERFRDKYVAVFGGEVVDSDKDETKLLGRIYRKYGYGSVYIHKVKIEEVAEEALSPLL